MARAGQGFDCHDWGGCYCHVVGRDQGSALINSTAPSPLPPPAKSYQAQKVSNPAAEKLCSIIYTISYTYLTSTLFCKALSRDYVGNMPSVQPQCLNCRVVWSSSVLLLLDLHMVLVIVDRPRLEILLSWLDMH